MFVKDLEIGSWYEFTNWRGRIRYCRYIRRKTQWQLLPSYYRHVFRFLDGAEHIYSTFGVKDYFQPCSVSFSEYLDLFVVASKNEGQ